MKKLFSFKFVVAGTRQLRKGLVRSENENTLIEYINNHFGYCEYLVITELQ